MAKIPELDPEFWRGVSSSVISRAVSVGIDLSDVADRETLVSRATDVIGEPYANKVLAVLDSASCRYYQKEVPQITWVTTFLSLICIFFHRKCKSLCCPKRERAWCSLVERLARSAPKRGLPTMREIAAFRKNLPKPGDEKRLNTSNMIDFGAMAESEDES